MSKDEADIHATRAVLEGYAQVEYKVHARPGGLGFRFQPGQKSPELERLFDENGVQSAAYLSAWDPDAEEDEEDKEEHANKIRDHAEENEENKERHQFLKEDLEETYGTDKV